MSTTGPARSVSRSDAVALGIIATGAITVAIGAVVAIVQGAFETFGTDVTVRMPVIGEPVPALADVDGISAAVYAAADTTFTDLTAGIRVMLLLEGTLPAVATIGVCLMVWWLGLSLLRSRPFRRAMPTALAVVAILVLVGGLFGQLLGAIARGQIVADLSASDPEVTDVFWLFLVQLDLAPIGWCFALALMAGAFSIGQRLQKDSEGLV